MASQQELENALQDLLSLMTSERRYEIRHSYTFPEVQQAIEVLGHSDLMFPPRMRPVALENAETPWFMVGEKRPVAP